MVGLVVIFATAMWCASLAAPGQSLATVTGCSQNNGAMEMTGCDQFLCGFDSSSKFLSRDARGSSDSVKSGLTVIATSMPLSGNGIASGRREFTKALPFRSDKVSIRLFNSILNL